MWVRRIRTLERWSTSSGIEEADVFYKVRASTWSLAKKLTVDVVVEIAAVVLAESPRDACKPPVLVHHHDDRVEIGQRLDAVDRQSVDRLQERRLVRPPARLGLRARGLVHDRHLASGCSVLVHVFQNVLLVAGFEPRAQAARAEARERGIRVYLVGRIRRPLAAQTRAQVLLFKLADNLVRLLDKFWGFIPNRPLRLDLFPGEIRVKIHQALAKENGWVELLEAWARPGHVELVGSLFDEHMVTFVNHSIARLEPVVHFLQSMSAFDFVHHHLLDVCNLRVENTAACISPLESVRSQARQAIFAQEQLKEFRRRPTIV